MKRPAWRATLIELRRQLRRDRRISLKAAELGLDEYEIAFDEDARVFIVTPDGSQVEVT